MNRTITISEARAQLPNIVKKVSDFYDRVTISVSGKPRAIIISQDELESLEETAEVMAIPGIRKALKESEEQIKRDQHIPLEKLLKSDA